MHGGVEALLNPRSVAVVGASPRESSLGFRVVRNLKHMGFEGRITPINPRYEDVAGLPCRPSLDTLDAAVDVAVLAVPAAAAVDVVAEAVAAGVRALVIPAGGFEDSGSEDGRQLHGRLVELAAAHGLAICGPNNMGLINVHRRAALWTASKMPTITPGRLAIVSQSGSVAIALSQDERRLGLSHVISSGNESVLTAADYLLALASDDRVGVIALFLETIRNPQLFAQAAARALANGKRIVALKVGRSEVGRAAVAAHTGALAGEQPLYEAFFRKCGVLAANDFEELTETAALCLSCPEGPATPNAVMLTLSGGEAALAADLGSDLGLSLPALSDETVDLLRPVLPPLSKPSNPMDAWGLGWEHSNFKQMLDAIASDSHIGTLAIAVDAPASGGGDTAVAMEMAQVAGQLSGGPRIAIVNNIAGALNEPLAVAVQRSGGTYLVGLRPAIAALSKWTRARPDPAGIVNMTARAAAVPMPNLANAADPERFRMLRSAGLPMAPCVAVRSPDEAASVATKLGFPVVLKGTAPALAHRSELGLVRLRLDTADAVREAQAELALALDRHAPSDSKRAVVAQPMFSNGVELIIGVRNEPGFGTLVIAGLGGIFVEILRDTAQAFAPLDLQEAKDMLRTTRAGAILDGARGHPPCDIEAAARALVALAEIGLQSQPHLAVIEINPLIVLERGRGAVGVDVVIETQQQPALAMSKT
jgi:acyl-CoA synthetase (NDP forming)